MDHGPAQAASRNPAETGTEEGVESASGQAEELGADVTDDAAKLGEDGEAEALRSGTAVLLIESRDLEDLQQVEGQHLKAEPGGVGAELVGRVAPGGQRVLEDMIDVLDPSLRSGRRPCRAARRGAPARESSSRPTPASSSGAAAPGSSPPAHPPPARSPASGRDTLPRASGGPPSSPGVNHPYSRPSTHRDAPPLLWPLARSRHLAKTRGLGLL